MGEGESTEWPDDNTDPFGDVELEKTTSLEKAPEDDKRSRRREENEEQG